jgi:fumarate reductase subunit C
MAAKQKRVRTSKEIWLDVLAFANSFAADLAKYFIVLAGLLLVAYVLRLVKLGGVLSEGYVDILEKIDFAANLAVILILVIDFITRLFRAYRESE